MSNGHVSFAPKPLDRAEMLIYRGRDGRPLRHSHKQEEAGRGGRQANHSHGGSGTLVSGRIKMTTFTWVSPKLVCLKTFPEQNVILEGTVP